MPLSWIPPTSCVSIDAAGAAKNTPNRNRLQGFGDEMKLHGLPFQTHDSIILPQSIGPGSDSELLLFVGPSDIQFTGRQTTVT